MIHWAGVDSPTASLRRTERSRGSPRRTSASAWTNLRFRPEPLRPMWETVYLSPTRFGKVRKAYVHTSLNRAVSPAYQRVMASRAGIRNHSLKTSHSPFFTRPVELANILMTEISR